MTAGRRSASRELGTLLKKGGSLSGHERNCGFLNLHGAKPQNDRFANISAVSGLDFADDSRGLALVDWDYDGDQDIWFSNRNAPRIRFMRNNGSAKNHFLALRLKGNGTNTNRDAIGARIELESMNGPDSVSSTNPKATSTRPPMIQTLRAGEGFISQNSKWVHFGLGTEKHLQKATVLWPGGTTEAFSNLDPDRHYELIQGTGTAQPWQPPVGKHQLVAKSPNLPGPTEKARSPLVTLAPLPSFKYESFAGKSKVIKVGEGKPLLINLWATWCLPCVKELKEFTDQAEILQQHDLEIIALSVDGLGSDKGDPATAEKLIDKLGFPFTAGRATPQLLDLLQEFHDALIPLQKSLPIPSSFLIDAQGRLSVIYKGPVTVDQLVADLKHSSLNREERLAATVDLLGQTIQHPRVQNLMSRDDARSLFQIVRITQRTDPRAAKKTYEEIIRLAPDFAQAHSKLGIVCLQLGEIAEAKQHLLNALAIDPNLPTALYNMGIIAARSGNFSGAEEYFRKVAQGNPHSTEAVFNLGIILLNQRKYKEAKDYLNKALKLSPGNADIHYNHGNANAALNNHEDAIHDYSLAIQLQPTFFTAYRNRAKSAFKLGKYDDATNDYTKAIKLAPQNANLYFNRGQLRQLRGRTARALDDYDATIRLNPMHVMAYNNKAWILATSPIVGMRNGKEAVANAERAFQMSKSKSVDILDTQAAAYAEDKQFQKAIESQTKAIALAPADSKPELLTRLKLYQAGKPFRQGKQSDSE